MMIDIQKRDEGSGAGRGRPAHRHAGIGTQKISKPTCRLEAARPLKKSSIALFCK